MTPVPPPVPYGESPARQPEVVATITRPARSTMQAGEAATKVWVLELEPRFAPFIDPLMGWVGGTDPDTQIRMTFPTREQAETFARRQGWAVVVRAPHGSQPRPKSYADNFTSLSGWEQS